MIWSECSIGIALTSCLLTICRMEEPPSPPKKESKKRAREPEAEEVDSATPSKAEKKKLKKLKAADGEAVSVAVEADVKAKKAEEIIESKDQKKDKKKKEKKEKSEDSTPLKTQELAGGVKALDKTIGTGPEAKKGDTVSMRYVGKLEDGNVFDSNMKGKPVSGLSSDDPRLNFY